MEDDKSGIVKYINQVNTYISLKYPEIKTILKQNDVFAKYYVLTIILKNKTYIYLMFNLLLLFKSMMILGRFKIKQV